jgi:hypothetical protein
LFSHTVGHIYAEDLQTVTMLPAAWPEADAFPETAFMENALSGDDAYSYFEDLNASTPSMLGDESEEDTTAYFADGEESHAGG